MPNGFLLAHRDGSTRLAFVIPSPFVSCQLAVFELSKPSGVGWLTWAGRASIAFAATIVDLAVTLQAGSARQRMPPPQPREPTEIPVGRDPLAARFDGQGGEICVRDQVSLGSGGAAQAREDVPVP